MKSYRILVAVHSLCAGGTERVVSTLIQQFSAKSGLEIHCVLYGRHPEIFYHVPSDVCLHLPAFKFDDYLRPVAIFKSLVFLRSTIRRVRPDVFLSFGERWNNFALIAAFGLPVRSFVADRSEPSKSIGYMHELLRRIFYPRASGVIVQTNKAATLLRRKINRVPIEVIPNPLFRVPTERSLTDNRRVLFVGRLIRTKHVDRLIRIFSETRLPGWSLVIVGGEAQNQALFQGLKDLAEELGLSMHVSLEGNQSDVTSYYLNASIFAFTSSSEGFPNVVAEALGHGLPVIAYDCSAGPSDLIESGFNGFLIDTFDDTRFVEKLSELMKDDELRKKMATRAALSVSHLEPSSIANRFLNFIALSQNDQLKAS